NATREKPEFPGNLEQCPRSYSGVAHRPFFPSIGSIFGGHYFSDDSRSCVIGIIARARYLTTVNSASSGVLFSPPSDWSNSSSYCAFNCQYPAWMRAEKNVTPALYAYNRDQYSRS